MNGIPHINSAFDEDLEMLNKDLDTLGELASNQLREAISALNMKNVNVLDNIIQKDRQLDVLEDEIHNKVLNIMALRSPLAEDLRRVVVVLKIASILERVGDYAKNIAKRSKVILSNDESLSINHDFSALETQVQKMLKKSLKAYRQNNGDAFESMWEADEAADELHAIAFHDLLEKLVESRQQTMEVGSHLLFIAKNLERVGDYSTKIAELVYFIVSGMLPEDKRPKGNIGDVPKIKG